MDFGTKNIVLPLKRGYLTMFKQILTGLETLETDFAFLCEHDVLYHPSHFEYTPPTDDAYYYNENVWHVNAETGEALFYWTKQVAEVCANRELLVEHYRKRVKRVEDEGKYHMSIGFEAGAHKLPRGIDDYPAESRMSEYPNIDIRHNKNLTPSRWSQDEFRDKKTCQGWKLTDEVPGWGITKGRFNEILESCL
jgi:hypothetical protein